MLQAPNNLVKLDYEICNDYAFTPPTSGKTRVFIGEDYSGPGSNSTHIFIPYTVFDRLVTTNCETCPLMYVASASDMDPCGTVKLDNGVPTGWMFKKPAVKPGWTDIEFKKSFSADVNVLMKALCKFSFLTMTNWMG